jgi:subtilisin-like proprotein convertase family protein
VPFPNLNIVWTATNSANLDPTDPTTYDGSLTSNTVAIPPNGNLANIIGSGNLYFAVSDTTSIPVEYNLVEEIITTNAMGNFYEVYSNLNNSLGSAPYYYRYESGTSMAAADVSGVLALMQDYFTNTLHITPSPALLKAMLINGARLDGDYTYAVTNSINLEGWGLVNLPNSIPATLTNSATSTNSSLFFADQSPTNALATGDSLTYNVTVPAAARGVHLRVTLAWTDPPGNPAAAIKLVNSLELVVTNLGTGKIYYGNNFNPTDPLGSSQAFATNGMPVTDAVNNVQNVIIPPNLDTNYSVTIVGRSVNVNAVTTQATNIAQDFALVISGDDGGSTNGISVAATASAPAPSLAPQVTVVGTTNQPYFDQIVGANAPLLSTNTIAFGTNSPYATNAVLTIGQTNQWHFYVVNNMTTYTNAAFITFIPSTLAIPREGVFAGSDANSTLPEANLDLYVASEPGLTNLDPVVIFNCMFGVNGDSASLARGGTKFVVYNNSTQNQVYYVGVKCEDQMGGEYAFLPAFSPNAFSTQDTNGNVYVTALNAPLDIPDGDNQHPGVGYVFGLCVQPIELRNVIVSNTVTHQNFGDLVGYLSHGENYVTLNNHDELGELDQQLLVYDDGTTNEVPGAQRTDGPGSLNNFRGQQGVGLWLLTEMDEAYTQTGRIDNFTLKLEPHMATNNAGLATVTVPAGGWYYDYVDVPVGCTNITVVATNITIPPGSPPVQLYLNYLTEPTASNNLGEADLVNGMPPGGSVSYGPPLTPGLYYIGLYNPDSSTDQTVLLGVNLAFSASAETVVDYDSTGAVPLLDDAVNYAYMDVTNTDVIQGISVGLRVDHPRISDLVFTLVDPEGNRYLLMENRGGQSTNGCGVTVITTNSFPPTLANGGAAAQTNRYNVGTTSGTFQITYNFYSAPDEMTIYYGTNVIPANLIFDTQFTNNPPTDPSIPQSPTQNVGTNTTPETLTVSFPPAGVPASSTSLTIVMNQFGNYTNPVSGQIETNTLWTYTAGGVQTNFVYLAFTEDTNLTVTPIKFAPPPFVPQTNFTPVFTDSFEAYTLGTYYSGTPGFGGWVVAAKYVDVVTNQAFDGTNSLRLDDGVIYTNVVTVPGRKYNLTYAQDSALDGSNTNWQPENYVFTASTTNTTLLLAASATAAPGATFADSALTLTFGTNMVLDDLVLTELPSDLYYQAEQDISGLTGERAYGTMANGHPWQLEILDNRAGATATNAPMLLGWQLEFTFANTNPPVATTNTLVGGIAQINTVASNTVANNSIVWYAVTVPIKASQATNLLLFATGPVNVWFSTNVPPSIVDAGDTNLISGQTNGISILTTNTASWPYIITNGTYYLGVQNLNTNSVTYGIEVDFDHGNAPGSGLPSLVIGNVKVSGGSVQLSWAATSSAPYVQWKTNLTAAWNTVTNPATATTNGVATFTDNGAQTAPLGPMRFYRLVQVH